MSGPLTAMMAVLTAMLLSGCGNLSRLSEVGRPPALSPISDPTRDPSWRPLTMPMPASIIVPVEANSLWRPGSRAFFKDQRAAQIGDIVTVLVKMNDNANLQNVTAANRTSDEAMGIPDLFGFQKMLNTVLPKPIDASKLVSLNSANTASGKGQIQRTETVTLRLAGVITQVLPNGNLVVAARQEFRVNSELRELLVSGVIRPQDIASDNTVVHDRMAEARITYGGRGQLTEVQTPRYGQQILDIVLPF